MLPYQLLITRTHHGSVRPVFIMPSSEALELARKMISIYSAGAGKRHREVVEEAAELESGPFDFRLVRGLKVILDRISTYGLDSPVPPREIRRTVFAVSGRPALSEADRSAAISAASKELGIPAADVERFFWGDLEGERVLSSSMPIEPVELLAEYNLSLMQTLLFRSTSLQVQAPGNWKLLLRRAKQLGLMYEIEGSGEGQQLVIEGPASAVQLTDRYGTSLAKLVPHVTSCSRWSIRAAILPRWRQPRQLSFSLSSDDGVLLPGSGRAASGGGESFDSSLEESLYRRFSSVGSKWRILREPEMIEVGGGRAFLPDFAFELHGRRVYLEIVGFWTQEYLSRKIEKLKGIGNIDLIIAVDRNLGTAASFPGEVVLFDKEVPLKPILDHLERAEAELVERAIERLSSMHIPIRGEVVHLGLLAELLSVPQDALRNHFESNPPMGYALAGGFLVKESKMAELDAALSKERSLKRACEMLEKAGISDPFPLLDRLGYAVRMSGLAIEEAEIIKKEKNGEKGGA